MSHRWDDLTLAALLAGCRPHLTPRQMRLFACACVRRLPSARRGSSARAIELAERFADGRASAYDLAQARFSGRFLPGHAAWAVCWPPGEDDWAMLERALAWATGSCGSDARGWSIRREEQAQAELLGDICPHPVRRPAVEPLWRAANDGAALCLARVIYDERCFEQMPILADALEEAGCDASELLEHCRMPREHVRGCWALDAVLGLSGEA